jgi:hypothetical protein
MSEPRDDAGTPTTVSVTTPISSRRVAIETQPQRIMLEVQARTVAKVLALVLAFSIVVSLLDTVRTVIVWFGIALFLAIVLNPLWSSCSSCSWSGCSRCSPCWSARLSPRWTTSSPTRHTPPTGWPRTR